jgi:AcrR family transcriptional regulator
MVSLQDDGGGRMEADLAPLMRTLADGEGQPIRSRNRASTATINRIVLEAERLFAEHGIDRVSLREIAVASGQKNTDSVSYHFGDREGLVQAIKHHYTIVFEPLRKAMLDAATAMGRDNDVRALLEILVLPYLSVTVANGTHSYIAFISQDLARRTGFNKFYPFLAFVEDQVRTCSAVLARLRDRLIFLPEEVFQFRVRAAIAIFANAIQSWDSLRLSGVTELPLEQLVLDCLSQMAASVGARSLYEGQNALLDIAMAAAA